MVRGHAVIIGKANLRGFYLLACLRGLWCISDMNNNLVKGVVLALSITACGAYIWNASRNGPSPAPTPTPAPPGKESAAANPFGEGDVKTTVTDEEVKRTRDNMLFSSKSGVVMSEADVRKMLEEEKQMQANDPPEPEPTVTDQQVREIRERMMTSSKSGRIMSEEDVRKMLEKQLKDKEIQPNTQAPDPFSGGK